MDIASVCPDAPAAELRAAAERYGINTPLRQAHWLAQMAHESGGFKVVRESLNYSVEALLSLFGRHRISERDARRYGRAPGQAANQTAIANCLYGGEWGAKNLGNTQSGDGARYIGRGYKQLTGRANYAACGAGIDLPLLAAPELLEQPDAAALSAGWFWHSRRLNDLADLDDIEAVTKKINGGLIGLAERKAWLTKFKAVL